VEGTVVTLSSDVVKSGASDVLQEKIVFMNHKAVRFYRTDSILQVFVIADDNSVMPADDVSKACLPLSKARLKYLSKF